jgi:membrane fusion protein (multidrug efflux system)
MVPLLAILRHWALACLLLGPVHSSAQTPNAGGQQGPPPAVTVEVVRSQDVAQSTEFMGRVEPINAVDIRARVEGFLQRVAFREGQDVHRGDLLFVIEQTSYQSAVLNAQAQLARSQATLRNAEETLARAQQLRSTGAGTQAALDQALAARDAASADVQASTAALQTAQLNLSYTQVSSPIDGRIGVSTYTEGNLVGPTSNPLARVVQINPIRVVFSISDRDLLSVRQEAGNAPREEIYRRFVPTLRLPTGTQYPQSGTVEFINNEIDPATGTIPVRASFPNPQDLLLPGDYVTVMIRPAKAKPRLIVPLAAVQQDRNGKFVLVVGPDNRTTERRIEANTQLDQSWVVDGGLQEGETLVVEGAQNVRPGMVVNPVAAAPANQALPASGTAGQTGAGQTPPAAQGGTAARP